MKNNNIKQLVYRPRKLAVKPLPKKTNQEVTFPQVLDYFTRLVWKHRSFLLITFIVLENILLLVRMK